MRIDVAAGCDLVVRVLLLHSLLLLFLLLNHSFLNKRIVLDTVHLVKVGLDAALLLKSLLCLILNNRVVHLSEIRGRWRLALTRHKHRRLLIVETKVLEGSKSTRLGKHGCTELS